MTKKKQHQANAEIFTATLFYLQDNLKFRKQFQCMKFVKRN